ncbi:MAG: AAA family ATPase [Polaromonas sp.]|nr:AAA family ATPase [Polaromonas sp.]
MSRRRIPVSFANSQTQPVCEVLESDLVLHCQKWALRALVDLGGYQSVVMDGHCSEPGLITYLGVSINAEDEYCQNDVLAALRAKHRAILGQELALPHDSPLIANVHWLAEQVGLTTNEQNVLLFCVLLRQSVYLHQAMDTLGELNNTRVYSVLSVLLELSVDEVSKAFATNSGLSRAGLVRIDGSQNYPFSNKVELIQGLSDRMMVAHENQFDLFADNFIVAPQASLGAERFDHIKLKMHHLQMYLRHALEYGKKGVNVLVYGPPGTGKTEFTRTLSRALGAELFQVAVEDADGDRIAGPRRLGSYCLSQKILAVRKNTLIVFDEIEDINLNGSDDDDIFHSCRGNPSGKKGWINQLLEQNQVPAIWISNNIHFLDPAHLRRFDYHLHLDIPPARIRATMLADHVAVLGVSNSWCESMAANESLAPAMMARAAKVAGDMQTAGVATPIEGLLDEVIESAMTAQSCTLRHKPSLAGRMAYQFNFANADCDLAQVVEGLRSGGEGRLCLYGPSGTGKSAFAVHVAEQLGLPPMLQRASDILSPYRGETEARMAEMFRRAQDDKAVLILDEADSFLRSREQARQSWEITAVNEMLTQIEAFQGIFFATTNLMNQIDAASMRRFDAKICFGYLKAKQCTPLLTDACQVLGIECDELAKQALLSLDKLTPGDFANVLRQTQLLPVRSAQDFIDRLTQEIKHKHLATSRPIGFLAAA